MQPFPTLVGLRTTPSAWSDRRYGVAHVTVLDADGRPLPGALVTGLFAGDLAGTRSAVTDERGHALLQCGPGRRSSAFLMRPEKLRTDLSISDSSAFSLSGRFIVLRTAASRLRPGRSLFWTSLRRSMEGFPVGAGTLHQRI